MEPDSVAEFIRTGVCAFNMTIRTAQTLPVIGYPQGYSGIIFAHPREDEYE